MLDPIPAAFGIYIMEHIPAVFVPTNIHRILYNVHCTLTVMWALFTGHILVLPSLYSFL